MTAPELELPAAWSWKVIRGLIAVCEADPELNLLYGPVIPPGSTAIAAIYQGRPDKPDRLTSWTPYPVSPGDGDAMERLGVQVWMRYAGQNPRAVGNLAEAIRDTLDGLAALDLPTGVSMSLCTRTSGTSLGQDSAGRWTHVENFYVDASHPTAHRI